MQIAERVRLEHDVRQTHGGLTAATAALLSLLYPAPHRVGFDRAMVSVPGQLGRSFSGQMTSNSSVRIETTSSQNINQSLAHELTRIFTHIVQHQSELDSDAKRALYGNLRRLYRR